MVIFPGCPCCGETIPCEDCQSQCGYQVTVDRSETADDLETADTLYNLNDVGWNGNLNGAAITPGKAASGPTSCSGNDYAAFLSNAAAASAGDGDNYAVTISGQSYFAHHLAGGAHSASTSTPDSLAQTSGNAARLWWVTGSYSFSPGQLPPLTAQRSDRFLLEWGIQCEQFVVDVVDEVPVTALAIVLRAHLFQDRFLSGNQIQFTLANPSQSGQLGYTPPYVFDGSYENEWPFIDQRRKRSLAYVLATSCREPDSITESCRADDGPVVNWRPAFVGVTASEDGITLTTGDGAVDYPWQNDEMLSSVAEWREYSLNTQTGFYDQVFKRSPNGEPYFDDVPPLESYTWEGNFLSTSGVATVTFDDFCGLSLVADEDTIEVPEGAPLPLGEEQAAYVNGYATEVTPDTNCPIVTYPSWSVYWKHKHLLITDLAVARCGEIPSVTTFTVWLYFDGLINDQLTGNEINGVPVGGFVMAVRSWNVTVVLGQPPVITPNSSTSPCSVEGEMPFCDGLVPEFEITYVEA
jgi:hypothetical protein